MAAANGPASVAADKVDVSVKTRHRYYEISGSSELELRADMDRRGPRLPDGQVVDAMTEWTITAPYDYRAALSECVIVSANVRLNVRFTYPRWRDRTAARSYVPELDSAWADYLRRLSRHERQHARIALAGAQRLSSRLRSFPAHPSCFTLDRAVDRLVRKIVRGTDRRQQAYDEQTDQGGTEGVRFP